MEGKSAFEIQGSARVLREKQGEIVEEKSSPWIKLSTTFRTNLLRELKGSQLSVFLCLALHIDDANQSYPSIETISNETGFSDRQITRAIQSLEKKGWISITRKDGSVNIYELSPVVAFGKTKPQDVSPAKMSPLYMGDNDRNVTPDNVTPPLTKSPLTMSDEEESLRRTNKKNQTTKNKRGDRPPAVELCKRIIFRYPHKSLWKTIDRNVGNELVDLLRWGRIMRKWRLSNFNITNYRGMLENFNRDRKHDDNIDYMSDKNRRKYLKGWFDD